LIKISSIQEYYRNNWVFGGDLKENTRTLNKKFESGERLTWLTCYDYSFARVIDSTDIDMILVGDSGGMVTLGYKDTTPVTMEEMIMLSSAVRRGAPNKFIVGDMPKGSYEVSDEDAVRNAMRFVKESGCDAVKLEGDNEKILSRVKAIVESGIVVIGHIGLTPQSLAQQGGYRVVGRDKKEISRLEDGVRSLIKSGVFSILLEAVPPNLAQKISSGSNIIIFGIGAGEFVHGQLLILHDLIGLFPDFRPKFAKCFVPQIISKYEEGKTNILENIEAFKNDGVFYISKLAIEAFVTDVKNGKFPSDQFSYKNN
jgi:3-methyl-2-oxobutanoate hydroxymethyltransferase